MKYLMDNVEKLEISENETEAIIIDEGSNELQYLNNDLPAQMFNHLDFVVSNKSGHILLGSSNLTGRYWGGSIWYYKDPHAAPDLENCVAAEELLTGVVDCDFIEDDRVVLGQDGGFICFVSIKDSDGLVTLEKTSEIECHTASVNCVQKTCDKASVVTASLDGSIRVWDCESTACKKVLHPAHTQAVTSLSPHPNQPEVFLSSSLDGNVLMWDLRLQKPASCIYRHLDDCPTAVSWVPNDESYLVGTLSGRVHLRDPKNISEDLFSHPVLERPVYRIVSNDRSRTSQLAVCGDDVYVSVITASKSDLKISYTDERHSDFVRGLTWLEENHLVSCGWDKRVLHHSI